MVLEDFVEVRLDIQELLTETKSEIEKIKNELDNLEEEKEFNINEVTQVLTLCSDLAEQFDKLKPANQRRLVMTAFKRISSRKGEVKGEKFNSIDIAWTEPFQILHEKWFSKVWKQDKKKGGPSMMSGGKSGIVKIDMRESDKVGRQGRIRLNASKTRWFCPSESKPTRFPASLSSTCQQSLLSCPLSLQTVFSSIQPDSYESMNSIRSSTAAKKGDSDWREAVGGVPRGYVPLVAGRSPRRGGSEPEGRTLEGGSQFPLQGDEGMALKIRSRAEDISDGKDNLKTHAHTK